MAHKAITEHYQVSSLTCAAGLLSCPLVCSLQNEQRLEKHVRRRLPHKLAHKVLKPLQATALRAAPLSLALFNDAPRLCFALPLLKVPAQSGRITRTCNCNRNPFLLPSAQQSSKNARLETGGDCRCEGRLAYLTAFQHLSEVSSPGSALQYSALHFGLRLPVGLCRPTRGMTPFLNIQFLMVVLGWDQILII